MLRAFLHTRPGPNGCDLLERLGPPMRQEGGWFCFPWKDFSQEESDKLKADKKKRWKRGWHGCKLEALYSILFHGELRESRDAEKGERCLQGLPGIYLHKDKTSRKAENYIRFVPLCSDGVFWAAKWEVRCDRSQAIGKEKHTDQWVQPAGTVKLVSLWLCGRTREELRCGDSLSRAWIPEFEGNPQTSFARSSLETRRV